MHTTRVSKSLDTIKILSQSHVHKIGPPTLSEREKRMFRNRMTLGCQQLSHAGRGAATIKSGGSTTKTESTVMSSITKPASHIGSTQAPKNGN